MASRPLGEVGVAVDGTIDPLLAKFAAAEKAAEAFYKRMAAKLARVPVGGAGGAGASGGGASGAANTERAIDRAAKAGNRYHQTVIQVANDNRTLIQIIDNSTRTFNNQRTSIDNTSRSVSNITNNYQRAGAAAAGMERETRRANSAAGDLRRTLLASAAVIVGAFGANEVKNLADSYTRFTNQLKVAGLEGTQLASTQEDLFGQAQKYGVELESLGGLYGRLAQSQRELGATSQQVIQFTNGVAAAIKIQGAGTEASRGALTQLSQALGGTIVRAEEYNSINEGARPILQAVANSIDRFGGSIAKLRAEVVEGKVTSQEFFQAFLRGSAQLEAQAAQANLTIAASFTTLNNALGRYIGQADQSLSVTQRVSAGIKALAGNLDVVVPIVTALIIAMGSRYVAAAGSMIASTALARLAVASFGVVTQGTLASVAALGVAGAATGRALLAAFGGPVGIAIMAIAGAVYYFHQRAAAAAKEVDDFNQHQKEAVRILADERERAAAAGAAIKGLGDDHAKAAGQARAFAGATGDAARALEEQARAARRARFETLTTAYENATQDQLAAERFIRERGQSDASKARFGIIPDSPEVAAARTRRQEAILTKTDLKIAMAAAVRDPLESYVPNARTGGRDIPGEIAEYQRQLVAIGQKGDEEARRRLLDEIKLRQRILALMKTGLSLEIAQATASAEKIKAPSTSSSNAFTGAMADAALGGIGATITSRGRTRAEQQRLYDRYKVGKGPLAAKPGTSNHELGLARDIRKTPGMSLDKIRGAIEAAGGQITELLDEGTHFHVAFRKTARTQEQVQQEALQHEQQFGAARQQLNAALLAAREAQLTDEAEIAASALKRVAGERDRERDEIANKLARGEYTEAQASLLTALNEQVRTAQEDALKLKERQRQEEVIARGLRESFDRKQEQLQAEQDIARTATERRGVERRILANQKEYERQSLQAIIDSPFAKNEDKARAGRDLAALDGRYNARSSAIDRDAIEALFGTGPSDSRSGIADQRRGVERDRDDNLGTVDEATKIMLANERLTQEERERILQDAANRRVDIEMDAARRIMDLETARKTMQLQNAQDIASGLASIAEGIAGKQSGVYRALFATSKAFAIAQASIALYQNVAEAMKYGFPQNLPFIAAAVAQGATIMSNIQSISAGFKTGGFTGYGNDNDVAGAVHRNEYVFDAGATRRIGRQNLDSIRAGRNPTAGLRAAANDSGGLANAGSQQGRVMVKQMPGIAIEYRESITTGDVEIIAKRAVARDAPGVVAADMGRPNSKTRKSLQQNTTARGKKT